MRKIEWWAWWRRPPQQLRFLLAGAFNTAVGYSVFSVLFLLFGKWLHYLLIGLVAHIIAVIVAFIVYRSFVFQSTESWKYSFVRFNLSQLVGLAFGLVALYTLVNVAGWHPLLAQAVVTSISIVLNYALHRHFSFSKRDEVA